MAWVLTGIRVPNRIKGCLFYAFENRRREETGSNRYNSKYSCDINEAKSMISRASNGANHTFHIISDIIPAMPDSTLNARDILGQMQISRAPFESRYYQRFTYFLWLRNHYACISLGICFKSDICFKSKEEVIEESIFFQRQKSFPKIIKFREKWKNSVDIRAFSSRSFRSKDFDSFETIEREERFSPLRLTRWNFYTNVNWTVRIYAFEFDVYEDRFGNISKGDVSDDLRALVHPHVSLEFATIIVWQ